MTAVPSVLTTMIILGHCRRDLSRLIGQFASFVNKVRSLVPAHSQSETGRYTFLVRTHPFNNNNNRLRKILCLPLLCPLRLVP